MTTVYSGIVAQLTVGLFLSASWDLSNVSSSVKTLEQCITAISQWMSANRLKLNADKTELMWAGTKYTVASLLWPRPESDYWNRHCGGCRRGQLSTLQLTRDDWLIKVLRPTRHKIGHFGDVLPSQSFGFGLILKNRNKHNKSKHASITKIYYNIKWIQKTKARFGHLQRPPAWKRNVSILNE